MVEEGQGNKGLLKYSRIPEDGIIPVHGEKPKEPWMPFLNWDGYFKKVRDSWRDTYNEGRKVFEHVLQEKGISGEHELLSKGKVERGMWGNIKGKWFMNQFLFIAHGEGYVNGRLRTVSSLQFAWSPKPGVVVITELPVDKLVFKVEKEMVIPTVSFDLKPDVFIRMSKSEDFTLNVRVYSNPNDYLQDEKINKAVIKVSSSKLNSLRLLPVKIEE